MPSSKSKSGESSSSNVTTDHEEIRRWVQQRSGRPACVKATESGDSCLLRIDYPGVGAEDSLEPLDWEEFFEIFDNERLAFLYQDQKKDGDVSRFSKFVNRGQQSRSRSRHPGESAARKGGKSSGRSRAKARKSKTSSSR